VVRVPRGWETEASRQGGHGPLLKIGPKTASSKTQLPIGVDGRNELVESYLDLVNKLVRSMVSSRSVPGSLEVDDVVQDVAVELLQTIRGNGDKSIAWSRRYVASIVRRTVNRSISAHYRPDNYPLAPIHAARPEAWMLFQDYHLSRKLLTKKQLEAVELVYVYGLTQEQAAKKLGVDPRAVRMRLHSAIFRLKKIFK